MNFNMHSTTKMMILAFIFITCISIIPSYAVHAAKDDPGQGRLSGNSISRDFYDDPAPSPFSLYRRGADLNPYTGSSYIHQERFSGYTIVNGIDVSQWQKNIDWAKVKACGIDYALIRVGYRGYGSSGTLSENTKDIYYDKNMQNAAAAGISTGIYIFSQAITTTEAVEEANYILNHIGSYNVSMPLIMDFEYFSTDSGNTGRLYDARLSRDEATKICLAFCDTIAAAGYTPMIYANKSMLENQLNASDITGRGYLIWLANYTTNTTYAGDFNFWQYSSSGKVDGIVGNTDMNFYYAQQKDMALITSTTIAPISDQPYTGSAIKPSITITCQGQPLTNGVDYTLSYSNNKKIGTASITITGINRYSGTKTVSFKIVPKNMSNFKAKKKDSTSITLSWSKNTSGTGYQIYRSTAIDGTYKKIKTIQKNKTTTYKNTKLTAGERYYYKIRSYKKTGGTTYYGAFSSIKSIDTKIRYTRNANAKAGAILYQSAASDGLQLMTVPAKAVMPVSYYTKDKNGNGWYYVSYKSGKITSKGFIPAGKVTITCVGKVNVSDYVNVRKSYSTSSKKLVTLKKNTKVTVLSSKKKKGVTWYKVTFKKKKKTYTGWICSPYLKLI